MPTANPLGDLPEVPASKWLMRACSILAVARTQTASAQTHQRAFRPVPQVTHPAEKCQQVV